MAYFAGGGGGQDDGVIKTVGWEGDVGGWRGEKEAICKEEKSERVVLEWSQEV